MKITGVKYNNIETNKQTFAANSLQGYVKNELSEDVFVRQNTIKKSNFNGFLDKIKSFFKAKEVEKIDNVSNEISFGSRIDFSSLPYCFRNTVGKNRAGKDIMKRKIIFHDKPKTFLELCKSITPDGAAIFVNKKNHIDIDAIEYARTNVATRKIWEYAEALDSDINKVVKILKSTRNSDMQKLAQEIESKNSINAKVNLISSKDNEIVSALSTKDNIKFANLKSYIKRENINKKHWEDKRDHLIYDEPEEFLAADKLKDRKGKPNSSNAIFMPEDAKMILYTPNSKINDTVEISLPNLVGYDRIVKKYDFLDSNIDLNRLDESSYRAIHSMHRLFERFALDESGNQSYKKVDEVLSKIKDLISENGDDLYSGIPTQKTPRMGLYINSGKVNKGNISLALPNENTDGFINVVFDKDGKIVTLYDVTHDDIFDNFCPILVKDKNYTS